VRTGFGEAGGAEGWRRRACGPSFLRTIELEYGIGRGRANQGNSLFFGGFFGQARGGALVPECGRGGGIGGMRGEARGGAACRYCAWAAGVGSRMGRARRASRIRGGGRAKAQ